MQQRLQQADCLPLRVRACERQVVSRLSRKHLLVQVRAEGQRDLQDTILQTVWSEVTEKVHCDL